MSDCPLLALIDGAHFCRHTSVHAHDNLVSASICAVCRQRGTPCANPRAIPVTITRTERPKLRGLGDVVAALAQPIARVIDAVAGTNIANCGDCQERQRQLNQAVSFAAPAADARHR
ncbi:MAG: hypothetical protein JSS27_00965 [Planctomycetes bacterium]|nr:hypothetical protein [Planctomycetota bacterium]